MLPSRRLAFCCDILKENGGKGRVKTVGIRKEESAGRNSRQDFEYYRKSWVLRPILEWASDVIWDYIKSNNLPYPSLYDEGFHRIGCIGCPKATKANRYRDFERWPQYRKAYFNTVKKIIKLRNYSDLSAEQLWAKWMDNLPTENKDQTILFKDYNHASK